MAALVASLPVAHAEACTSTIVSRLFSWYRIVPVAIFVLWEALQDAASGCPGAAGRVPVAASAAPAAAVPVSQGGLVFVEPCPFDLKEGNHVLLREGVALVHHFAVMKPHASKSFVFWTVHPCVMLRASGATRSSSLRLRVGPADVVLLRFGVLANFPLSLPRLPIAMGTLGSFALVPVPGAELEDALLTPSFVP